MSDTVPSSQIDPPEMRSITALEPPLVERINTPEFGYEDPYFVLDRTQVSIYKGMLVDMDYLLAYSRKSYDANEKLLDIGATQRNIILKQQSLIETLSDRIENDDKEILTNNIKHYLIEGSLAYIIFLLII